MKKLFSLLLIFSMLFLFGYTKENKVYTTGKDAEQIAGTDKNDDKKSEEADGNIEITEENPMVTITVKGFGDMVLELYPEHAPITVANFLELAESGFYEGLIFHRIYKGFMIQGGSSDGMGMAGSENKIKGEFASNGVDNPISHERGVISMARTNVPDSASSQFFICDADSTFLDGSYAAFGKLVEGYDVLDAIASVDVTYGPSGEKSSPLVAPVIEKVTVNK